jgi:hypothetical protein
VAGSARSFRAADAHAGLAKPGARAPGAAQGRGNARRGRGGRPQLAAARESDWTEDKEAEFFATLGATLNVTAASAAAGFTSKTA